MDGQQRLTALGVDIRRADGTVNPPPVFNLHLPTGEWSDGGEGESWSLCGLARAVIWDRPGFRDLTRDTDHDDIHHPIQCYAQAQNAYVQVMEIQCPDDRAAEVFTTLAQPGVSWSPEELEALVQSIQSIGAGWLGGAPSAAVGVP